MKFGYDIAHTTEVYKYKLYWTNAAVVSGFSVRTHLGEYVAGWSVPARSMIGFKAAAGLE